MPLISIKLSGQKLVQKHIKDIREYLADLVPIAHYMRDRFSREVIANFNRGGTKEKMWPNLAASTRTARRERVGYYEQPGQRGILNWTGSIKQSFKVGGRHAHLRVTNRSRGYFEMEFGTNHPLARIHHFGSTFSRGPVYPTRQGGAIRMITSRGPQFAPFAGPAEISIPARPFWSDTQVERIEREGQKRALKRLRELANG